MLRWIGKLTLKLCGWRASSSLPPCDQYVLVGAPHTSNWDFPLAMLAMWATGLRFSWVGKHTLFKGPPGLLMRALGGIPVDRSSGSGLMRLVLRLFKQRKQLVLALAPEGTRSHTEYWKPGFYQIALAAKVPIALGYIDYPRKRLGFERLFEPSGDIKDDFALLQEYYRDKVGRHPENQGPVRVKGAENKGHRN